jgi:hypothetical protein
MDGIRFDTLSRALTAAGSRRLTLGMLLGGALGLLGLPGARAKRKSGRCQPKCDECYSCKKGQCRNKNGKKRCAKGKCKPKSVGAPCRTFPGGACQNGTCVNLQADETNCGSLGTACGPTQVCQAGTCFPKSTCPASPTAVCPIVFATFCGPAPCVCSHSTEGNVVCVSLPQCPPPIGSGTPCTTSATCPPGSACIDITACCGGAEARVCVPQCANPNA